MPQHAQIHFCIRLLLLQTSIVLILAARPAIATDFGNISGEFYFHGESTNPDVEEKVAFVNSHLGIKYETPTFLGMNLAAEVRNGVKIWERNSDDADDATGTLLSEAYIQYVRDALVLRIGRQELEQEWIDDYHEAATISFAYGPIFELYGGYTRSFAVADEEEISSSFEDIGKHGSSFLYLTFKNDTETWIISPYGLHTPDLYTAYGIKLRANLSESLGLGLHYAGSDVKETADEQTSIFHAYTSFSIFTVDLEVGFLQAGNDGIGLLDFLGENVNPLEEGNLVFEADATTFYTILTYSYDKIELQLILGNTSADEAEENEISLLLTYDLEELLEGASVETIYTSVNSENDSEDFSTFLVNLIFEFSFGSDDS